MGIEMLIAAFAVLFICLFIPIGGMALVSKGFRRAMIIKPGRQEELSQMAEIRGYEEVPAESLKFPEALGAAELSGQPFKEDWRSYSATITAFKQSLGSGTYVIFEDRKQKLGGVLFQGLDTPLPTFFLRDPRDPLFRPLFDTMAFHYCAMNNLIATEFSHHPGFGDRFKLYSEGPGIEKSLERYFTSSRMEALLRPEERISMFSIENKIVVWGDVVKDPFQHWEPIAAILLPTR